MNICAKQAFNLRNEYRIEAENMMTNRAKAVKLNAQEQNLMWEEIVKKQTDKGPIGDDIYRAITESFQRSRKSVNQKYGLG